MVVRTRRRNSSVFSFSTRASWRRPSAPYALARLLTVITHLRALLSSGGSELSFTGFQPWHTPALHCALFVRSKNRHAALSSPLMHSSSPPVAVFTHARSVGHAQPAVRFVQSSSPAVYCCTAACSASARVCAAVMSHSDTVRGRGELNATTKG